MSVQRFTSIGSTLDHEGYWVEHKDYAALEQRLLDAEAQTAAFKALWENANAMLTNSIADLTAAKARCEELEKAMRRSVSVQSGAYGRGIIQSALAKLDAGGGEG